MNSKRLITFPAVIGLIVLTTGCEPPVFPWLTKGVAPWWYVNDYWGGLVFNRMESAGGVTKLYFNFNVHEVKHKADGFTVYGGKYKVQGDRILISFYKWTGPDQISPNLAISVPNLMQGKYTLVYDDQLSSYPILGSVEIK